MPAGTGFVAKNTAAAPSREDFPQEVEA